MALRKIDGFTMMELVIVILILGILAVMPFYQWPGRVINLDIQAKLIVADLRYTQSLAMSKADRYRLVGTSATTYQILNGAGSAVLFPSGVTTASLDDGLSFGTAANLPNSLVAFDSRGMPYLDAAIPGTPLAFGTSYSFTISDGTNTKIISITPITGRISVQ